MGIVGTDSGENDDFVDSCMFFQPDGGLRSGLAGRYDRNVIDTGTES